MSAPRVAVVGARRVHQGLGPFAARALARAGLEVCAVLGTGEASVAEAREAVAAVVGSPPHAYTDLRQMLETEALDALVVLSPSRSHETCLEAALAARLHVLCEKPLLWGGTDLAGRALRLVERFRAAGLLLAENTLWPWTLPAWRALHPAAAPAPERTFRMLLAPISAGVDRLADSASHPLSLLQALLPEGPPRLEAIAFDEPQGPAGDLHVRFAYRTARARIDVELELRTGSRVPRPAGYGWDGWWAERRVELPDYAMWLVDGERRVALADPLTARVADFARDLRSVRAGAPPPDPAPLAERMALVDALTTRYCAAGPGPTGAGRCAG